MHHANGLRIPAYRRHKSTGQAVVTRDGRDFYLGRWKTLLVLEESQQAPRKPAAQQSPLRTGWTADDDVRNKWIYNQDRCGTPYKAIIAEIGRKIGTGKKWDVITSIEGITKASQAYAKRKGLQPAPKRHPGRPKTMAG